MSKPIEPRDNTKQFSYEVRENGELIESGDVDDPFVRTTLTIRGWRSAWHVLRGGLRLTVRVDGSREAHRVIFRGDYTKEPDGPQSIMGTRNCDAR